MTSKENAKLAEISSKLTTAIGMLMVPSMNDELVKQAKEMVTQATFDLDRLL